MTASSTTTTAAVQQIVTDENTTSDPMAKYNIAVTRIMQETGCTESEAVTALDFIDEMASLARTGERCDTQGIHHLTDEQMATMGYKIMDAIMEHNEISKPGSAHEAVQAHILGAEEYALTHGNPTGRAEDCVVTVSVGYVS